MCNVTTFLLAGRGLMPGISRVILVLLGIAFASDLAMAGAWTRKADINPSRVTYAAAVVDGKIYLMGGLGNGYLDTDYNYAFDPATNTWQKRAHMLTARSFVTAAALNGIIYTFGGTVDGLAHRALSVVEAYDPATDSCTPRNSLPNPRFGINTCVVDSLIYSIGGKCTLDSLISETCAYDPASDTWTARTPRPLTGGCAVVVYNGLIYTFGGRETTAKPASAEVYVYDPKADSWTRKKDMPTPRTGTEASVWHDKIYVIGGYQVENSVVAAVEVYDPATDTWEKLADMPEKTALHAQVELGGKIYVMAGTADWQTGGWHTWEFDPASNTEDVEEERNSPTAYELTQNYPNPFNPATTICYAVPHRAHVTLVVYNVLGQQVNELVDDNVEAGFHEVQFNASNLASGVYFYRMQAGTFVDTKTLLLVR